MNELVKRDKKIQQLQEHMSELEKMLKNNSKNIHTKEKTNKYLTNVKNNFKKYDETINNLKDQQLNSFNSLKIYLQSLSQEDNSDEIQNDINEIEGEIKKIMG